MKRIFVLFFVILHVLDVICVALTPVTVPEMQRRLSTGKMETIVYRTVNKYYCSAANVPGASLLMYGMDAWSFPEQDVNLTLRYPSSNTPPEDKEYIITGFKVILHMDSPGSAGFITDGGILDDSITLSFTSSTASMMQYQFWVYGVSRNVSYLSSTYFRLCT